MNLDSPQSDENEVVRRTQGTAEDSGGVNTSRIATQEKIFVFLIFFAVR